MLAPQECHPHPHTHTHINDLSQDGWFLDEGRARLHPINIKPIGLCARNGEKGEGEGGGGRVLLPNHKYESVPFSSQPL